jgi:transcriptional regulator with XRE-family HTH domain
LESLAACVVRARLRRGLTQERLAEEAGLTPRYIQQIERARVDPALSVFLAIAEALDVAPSLLLRVAKLAPARAGRPRTTRRRSDPE